MSQLKAARDLDLALRNLRHLYEQMVGGYVPGSHTANAANGLLSPAIEKLESMQPSLRRYEAIHVQTRRLLHVTTYEPGDESEAAALSAMLDAVEETP